jgi:predicted pyridoxine 5'-phosphate oxidase superfamily flavin-nucleotide-binding protein
MITADMKRLVAEQKLGFVATVNADGSPNVSPKGTMLVLDDDHLMFADIRSPGTMANLAERPAMEINFVDLFSRKGYRFKGTARAVKRGSAEFDALLARFPESRLMERYRAIVVLKIEKAAPLISPAYDVGSTEADLRKHYLAYFVSNQPKSDH